MIRFLEIGPDFEFTEKICYWCNDDGFRAEKRSLVFVRGSGGDHTLWSNQFTEL